MIVRYFVCENQEMLMLTDNKQHMQSEGSMAKSMSTVSFKCHAANDLEIPIFKNILKVQ